MHKIHNRTSHNRNVHCLIEFLRQHLSRPVSDAVFTHRQGRIQTSNPSLPFTQQQGYY